MNWFKRKQNSGTPKDASKKIHDKWEEEARLEALSIGLPTHEILIDGRPTKVVQAGYGFYLVEGGMATKVSTYHEAEITGFPLHGEEDRHARDLLLPLFDKMVKSERTEAIELSLGMGLTSPAVQYIGPHGHKGPVAYFYGQKLCIRGLRDKETRCDITTDERRRMERAIKGKQTIFVDSIKEFEGLL